MAVPADQGGLHTQNMRDLGLAGKRKVDKLPAGTYRREPLAGSAETQAKPAHV
jgi:hypothetical protein